MITPITCCGNMPDARFVWHSQDIIQAILHDLDERVTQLAVTPLAA
jgi:hypothetical protein